MLLSTWNIHYARWIIDDGEPEREVGENFPWPVLGFHSVERMSSGARQTRSALEADDYSYEVDAEILHVSPTAAVIDFVIAFGEHDSVPSGCKAGDYVAGRIHLSFLHYCDPSVPDQLQESMFHKWSTTCILADMTPYRSVDELAKRLIPDSQNARYVQVKSTRERNVRSYVLQCCLRHE